MAINQFAGTGTVRRTRPLLTMTGAVGAGYALSWVAGLILPAPDPALGASGPAVVAAFAGHQAAAAVSFALTEGLPAIGIAVVLLALARAAASTTGRMPRSAGGKADHDPARTNGATSGSGPTASTTGRVLRAAGLAAAVLSAAEFVLGLLLSRTRDPGAAHLLWATVDRIDGVKMLAFAVLGAAVYAAPTLPRWLRYTGAALAVSMLAAGVVYLLLVQSLAIAAGPALLFLLVLIAGAGIVAGARAR